MMIVMRMISLKDNDQDNYCFYHDYIIAMVYVFDPPSGYSRLQDENDENDFVRP